MGASMGGGSGGQRRRRGGRGGFSEINVTPMVDVMLVLLIIFMVAAPMLTSGVEVDLPKASSQPLKGSDEPITVSIKSRDHVYLQDNKVTIEVLGARLKLIAGEKSDTRILVRATRSIDYGDVMSVVGAINEAGFHKVALQTDAPQGKSHQE